MKLLRHLLWLLGAAAALAMPTLAWGALSCSITTSPSQVTGFYATAANLDVQGSFNVTCTRDPNADPRKPDIWIGVDQPTTGETILRDIGGSQLSYFVYRKTFGSGVWTNTGALGPNSNQAGGLAETLDFGKTGAVVSASFPFYFRVPSGQTSAAGIYVEPPVAVTLRADSDVGTVLSTASVSAQVQILHHCRVSTTAAAYTVAPAVINIGYTAFSAGTVTGSQNFWVTCTQGTTYTLAVDLTRSVVPIVELAYSLSLNLASGIGIAGAQQYNVSATIDAGQAGRCTTATCQGTDTRTITVTY